MNQPNLDFVTFVGSTTPVNSLTWSHIVGNVNGVPELLVAVSQEVANANATNLTITGVTFNGIALTLVANPQWSGFGSESSRTQRLELWRLPRVSMPVAGTYSIVVTFTGNVDACIGGSNTIYQIQGGIEAFNTGSVTNNNVISSFVTSLTNNALIFCAAACQNGSGYTAGAGETQTINQSIGGSGHALTTTFKIGPTPASYTMTETNSNGESQGIIVCSIPFVALGGAEFLFNFL